MNAFDFKLLIKGLATHPEQYTTDMMVNLLKDHQSFSKEDVAIRNKVREVLTTTVYSKEQSDYAFKLAINSWYLITKEQL
jgi:hypothetical protein